MKIVRSKLQCVFEHWIRDLETRAISGVELSMASTRLEGDPAFVLFAGKEGLYATLTLDREHCRHVCLMTMQARLGNESHLDAQVYSISMEAILTLSFITAHFFVDRSRLCNYADLYSSFPEIDSQRHVVANHRRQVDLTEFLH